MTITIKPIHVAVFAVVFVLLAVIGIQKQQLTEIREQLRDTRHKLVLSDAENSIYKQFNK